MPLLSLPDAPAARWAAAAHNRRSRRSFDGRSPDPEALDALEEACGAIRPFAGVRVALGRQMPPGAFKGIVGSYGRVHGAPSGMVMVASGSGDQLHAAVGYTGEALVLEATALGLGTCWVGGMFDNDLAKKATHLAAGERIFAISPLGYGAQKISGPERLVYRMKPGTPKPRKALEQIAPDIGATWPGWARAGVEAARIAPSAYNRQPWRFRMEGDGLVVSFDGPDTPVVSKRLDCGIAMLHVEIAIRAAGEGGSWELLEHRADVARFTFGD